MFARMEYVRSLVDYPFSVSSVRSFLSVCAVRFHSASKFRHAHTWWTPTYRAHRANDAYNYMRLYINIINLKFTMARPKERVPRYQGVSVTLASCYFSDGTIITGD